MADVCVYPCCLQAEFDYACNRKGVERILPVVMEGSCSDPRGWQGAIGMRLGNQLHQNLSEDGVGFNSGVVELVARIRSQLNEIHSRVSSSKTPRNRLRTLTQVWHLPGPRASRCAIGIGAE